MTVLHITTVPVSLRFLHGQIEYMRANGISAAAVSSPGTDLTGFGVIESVPVYSVAMTRRITPFKDILALIRLRRLIRDIRPSIVHAHTPKGGLLGMLAATLSRTPARVYHMRGLPYVTASGVRRWILKATERISCRLAHRVLCNSRSIRDLAVRDHLCQAGKIVVPGKGSGNGVDALQKFNPQMQSAGVRDSHRSELGIPENAVVIGYVGRVVRDKGIADLEVAWRELRTKHSDVYLLIVGPYEDEDPLPRDVVSRLENDERVVLTGTVWDTPPLYVSMDVVVLPTYREGFPNVPLEAAAMERPVVATDIPGCVDAVVDGETGILVPPGNPKALATAIDRYVADANLRSIHGLNGRERVMRDFQQEAVWEAILREYKAAYEVKRSFGVKRFFDFAASLLALVALLPLLLVIGLGVLVVLGRPILFKQARIGLQGQPFTIFKFRTMAEIAGPTGEPLPDSERMTWLGELLRKSSVDELPELWNVLIGNMSLVGPRPLLPEYLPLYSVEQARRHEVLPGLTGWAQIHGRNATTWEKRLELDVWYVDNHTFALDLWIILKTVGKVLSREGSSPEDVPTMKPFTGTAVK